MDLRTVPHIKGAAHNILGRDHGHLEALGQLIVIVILDAAAGGGDLFGKVQERAVLAVDKVRHLQRVFVDLLLQGIGKALLKCADIFQRGLPHLGIDHHHGPRKHHQQRDDHKKYKRPVVVFLQGRCLAFVYLHMPHPRSRFIFVALL